MNGDDMPPAGKGQDKVKRPVSLPDAMWSKIEELREGTGEHSSETLRRIINEGIIAETARLGAMLDAESKRLEAESRRLTIENQKLINRRLQAKENGAIDAVAFLKSHTDENVRQAADDLEQWLQKG